VRITIDIVGVCTLIIKQNYIITWESCIPTQNNIACGHSYIKKKTE